VLAQPSAAIGDSRHVTPHRTRPGRRSGRGACRCGRVRLEGPVEITFSDDAPSPGDQLIGKQTTKMLLPWSFLGGVNVDVTPHIEIGAEMRYWLYRQYKKMHTDVVGIFLVRELETIKNYRDSFQVSGGVRVHDLASAPGLELMFGTHFDRTPAPAQTVTLDQPTFNHVGLHTGLRYAFGRYRLGASYLHYFYDIPTVTNSITMPPSNFKGSGQNNIAVLSIEATL
jgi:long-subunit fatty acid transport protein